MTTYVCSNGHLVKVDNSILDIDSLCRQCKRQARAAYARGQGYQPIGGLRTRPPRSGSGVRMKDEDTE